VGFQNTLTSGFSHCGRNALKKFLPNRQRTAMIGGHQCSIIGARTNTICFMGIMIPANAENFSRLLDFAIEC